MIWRAFFARSAGLMDETFSKNCVTNSKNINQLQDLLRVFYIEY